MKTKRIFSIIFLLVFALSSVQAQMVSPVGLGVRLNPDGAGFTSKFFLDRNWAIEAQFNISQGFLHGPDNAPAYGPSIALVGLLEYHIILPDPSWRIFLGPGIHFGSWDMYHNRYDYYRTPQGIFGIDGILGLEYVLKSSPIGISLDVKPAMNFATDVGFFPNNMLGISGRYYLGHRMHASAKPQ